MGIKQITRRSFQPTPVNQISQIDILETIHYTIDRANIDRAGRDKIHRRVKKGKQTDLNFRHAIKVRYVHKITEYAQDVYNKEKTPKHFHIGENVL